jgi:hypothetical protein
LLNSALKYVLGVKEGELKKAVVEKGKLGEDLQRK